MRAPADLLQDAWMQSPWFDLRPGQALVGIRGIESAYPFGAWAARFSGQEGERAVNDLYLLVLGEPERNVLFEATAQASKALGRFEVLGGVAALSEPLEDGFAGVIDLATELGADSILDGDVSPPVARSP